MSSRSKDWPYLVTMVSKCVFYCTRKLLSEKDSENTVTDSETDLLEENLQSLHKVS